MEDHGHIFESIVISSSSNIIFIITEETISLYTNEKKELTLGTMSDTDRFDASIRLALVESSQIHRSGDGVDLGVPSTPY
jgi:hypothetical protein